MVFHFLFEFSDLGSQWLLSYHFTSWAFSHKTTILNYRQLSNVHWMWSCDMLSIRTNDCFYFRFSFICLKSTILARQISPHFQSFSGQTIPHVQALLMTSFLLIRSLVPIFIASTFDLMLKQNACETHLWPCQFYRIFVLLFQVQFFVYFSYASISSDKSVAFIANPLWNCEANHHILYAFIYHEKKNKQTRNLNISL